MLCRVKQLDCERKVGGVGDQCQVIEYADENVSVAT